MHKVYLIKSEDLSQYFVGYRNGFDKLNGIFTRSPFFSSDFSWAKIYKNKISTRGVLNRIKRLGGKAVIVQSELIGESVV